MVQDGHQCQKWTKVETIGDKVNRYTMWLKYDEDDTAVPVHYEMKGYNTLLGSHYDHYFVSYKSFKAVVLDDSHVFDIYMTENCHGWPGPGIDHTYTMNPMREFIDNDDSHVTNTFEDFKEKHNRDYASHQEHAKRLELYRQNLRFIHSKNRQALSYTLASNHLADRDEGELAVLRGRTHDTAVMYNGGLPQHYTAHMLRDIPAELDWRYESEMISHGIVMIIQTVWSSDPGKGPVSLRLLLEFRHRWHSGGGLVPQHWPAD